MRNVVMGDSTGVFRTAYNLLGYVDHEVVQGDSLTDPNDYVPIAVLVGRMQRGEVVRFRSDVIYEDDVSPDELLDRDDPTLSSDFDLADASAVRADIEARSAAEKKAKASKTDGKASSAPSKDGAVSEPLNSPDASKASSDADLSVPA